MPYQITEPHPTVQQYTYAGRGGAGNTFKPPESSNISAAAGPASNLKAGIPQTSTKFTSGRGGAGNIHPHSKRAIFSFDEEIERQSTRDQIDKTSAIQLVGRGGAGNRSSNTTVSSRKNSSSSVGSDTSDRSGFFGRLSHTIERR